MPITQATQNVIAPNICTTDTVQTVTAAKTFTGNVTTSNLINGTSLCFRNKIINGNFAINQRGYVSGTATSGANQYTLDRWRVVTSGQNLTFSASGNGNIVTAPAGGIEQVIESLNIEGGTYTLSWTGTATAAVNGAAVSNGGQVTLTANTNATIRFTSGTVSLVQLEAGSVATPFENRPIGTELALCQRYYEETGIVAWTGRAISSSQFELSGAFLVEKMASPTVTSISSFDVRVNSLNTTLTGVTILSANIEKNAALLVLNITGGVMSTGNLIQTNNLTSENPFKINAEL